MYHRVKIIPQLNFNIFLLGIRGELHVTVKVDLFTDFNKFRQSSCGVQFFNSKSLWRIQLHGYSSCPPYWFFLHQWRFSLHFQAWQFIENGSSAGYTVPNVLELYLFIAAATSTTMQVFGQMFFPLYPVKLRYHWINNKLQILTRNIFLCHGNDMRWGNA